MALRLWRHLSLSAVVMMLLIASSLSADGSRNNDGEYSANLYAWLRVEAGRYNSWGPKLRRGNGDREHRLEALDPAIPSFVAVLFF